MANLAELTTQELEDERNYLQWCLSNQNPFCKYTPSERRSAQAKLVNIKSELHKPYRR